MAHSERTTAVDGTEIAWSAVGEGDDVLLVHGITESAGTWAPIVDRLSTTNRVITLDLRGHGESGTADRYDLEAMAGDVAAVMGAASMGAVGSAAPHLVGHSLGGAVVSAAGAVLAVASVVNVDQSLQLGAFKAALEPAETMLRDEAMFPAVISQLFADMRGALGDAEFERVGALRRGDQTVVLGVWEMMFTMSEDEIAAVVDGALAGYSDVHYLSLFGIDPGPDYAAWLKGHIANSEVEVWDGAGHYPHLHEPDRFVDRVRTFWAA